ncbi:MAG: hypothetical protein B6D58_09550 [candidate division Zixibacteria bacterium 4484_95]|nr:MAG: hypothetical protein B6D58_09550 [candidate division Zixibacteria bacterium 4484_95]
MSHIDFILIGIILAMISLGVWSKSRGFIFKFFLLVIAFIVAGKCFYIPSCYLLFFFPAFLAFPLGFIIAIVIYLGLLKLIFNCLSFIAELVNLEWLKPLLGGLCGFSLGILTFAGLIFLQVINKDDIRASRLGNTFYWLPTIKSIRPEEPAPPQINDLDRLV